MSVEFLLRPPFVVDAGPYPGVYKSKEAYEARCGIVEKPAKFYLVGGAVRDEIMGKKSKDLDYAVECASFDAMREAIVERGGTIFLETPQYFTIRAKVPAMGACDFVLCRKDGKYEDGRRPETVEMGTLYDDLARRDFTMNAIAKGENGEYVDPFNGIEDIKRGLIRCVGNAEDRFNEDYLRMLRAIRFSVTKNMRIDTDINSAIWKLKTKIAEVSVERIREELLKAFSFNTIETLGILDHYGLEKILFTPKLGLRLKPTLEE